jgi:hypothetical protein
MSPNAGGGWHLRGLSQLVQLNTGVQINFGDLTPYLTYSHIPRRLKIFTWGFIRHAFLFILHEHLFHIYLFKPYVISCDCRFKTPSSMLYALLSAMRGCRARRFLLGAINQHTGILYSPTTTIRPSLGLPL